MTKAKYPPISVSELARLRADARDIPATARRRNTTLDAWDLRAVRVRQQKSILHSDAGCSITAGGSSSPVRKASSIALTVPEGSLKQALPIPATLSLRSSNLANGSSTPSSKWVTAPWCWKVSGNWLTDREASISGKRLPKWVGRFKPLRRQTPNKCSLRYS